jgi:hypothetical protein
MKALLIIVVVFMLLAIGVLGYGYLAICTPHVAHGIC